MTKNKDGSMTGEIPVAFLKKEVRKFGNTGHLLVPRKYVGANAEIKIKKNYIICQRCSETIMELENFSPDKRYCQRCFKAIKFLEKNPELRCKNCGKSITPEEFKQAWDESICESCWIKKVERKNAK